MPKPARHVLHLLDKLSGTFEIASFHANIEDTIEGNSIRLHLSPTKNQGDLS